MVIILALIAIPADCSASITGETDQPTIIELTEIFNHVFTVNVTGEIVTSDRTYYTLNVTEYLMTAVNSSILYFTVYGGSEVMVSPATILHLGLDYLFFCDEINEEYSITGLHYNYKLLNSVDPTEMEELRRTMMALKAATTYGTLTTVENAITNRELEQPVEPNTNLLLTIVYLCTAGIYITLIPVMKNGLKR